MGCDIHFFIEYKPQDNENYFNLGEQFRLDRHYGVFARLANVRNHGVEAISEPRGMPDAPARGTERGNSFYVTEQKETGEREISKETAEAWVKKGYSKYTDDRKIFITDPDAHSHSWLTCDELEEALSYVFPDGEIFTGVREYHAVLAAMRCLESSGADVRCVFWFDN